MRSALGSEPGEGGLLDPLREPATNGSGQPRPRNSGDDDLPDLDELGGSPLTDPLPPPADDGATPAGARPDRGRSSHLPTVAVDPTPGEARSRFDPDAGVVFYNDRHPDYLMVKEAEGSLLDYLATLVAKEYVVYNNPRGAPEDLTEEMVRMLVRIRRHTPKRK